MKLHLPVADLEYGIEEWAVLLWVARANSARGGNLCAPSNLSSAPARTYPLSNNLISCVSLRTHASVKRD